MFLGKDVFDTKGYSFYSIISHTKVDRLLGAYLSKVGNIEDARYHQDHSE